MTSPTRPGRSRTASVPAAVAAVVVLSLAGCGGDGEPPGAGAAAAQSEDGGDEAAHNDADVAFASQMIPHHAQALMMTDMTLDRRLSPELAGLVEDIRAAQAPEIELMADWLQEWGEPVPETVRDHVHGGHEGGDGADGGDMPEMSGMMSSEQLGELEAAPPAEFEELWLTMMIEHHEGAVTMAETQLQEGSFQPALDLAEEIASSQTAEIETMRGMLED